MPSRKRSVKLGSNASVICILSDSADLDLGTVEFDAVGIHCDFVHCGDNLFDVIELMVGVTVEWVNPLSCRSSGASRPNKVRCGQSKRVAAKVHNQN